MDRCKICKKDICPKLEKPGVVSFVLGTLSLGWYNVILQRQYDEHFEKIRRHHYNCNYSLAAFKDLKDIDILHQKRLKQIREARPRGS